MKSGLKALRKTKAILLRLKFHILVEPFSNFLLTTAHLSRLSKWISKSPETGLNDFYTGKHDYSRRYDLYKHIISAENLTDICYLEFGVAKGESFKWWVANIKSEKSRFVGFDTFSGLPEGWGHFKQGDMSAGGAFPDVNNDSRCSFEKGIFQKTLPPFLKGFNTSLRKVIHMDADIYSSTLFTLTTLGPLLKKDDILIFDEFNVPMHEFKAFSEFLSAFYVKVSLIGAVNNYYQAAFRIEENLSCRE